jgi:hypothetical protein
MYDILPSHIRAGHAIACVCFQVPVMYVPLHMLQGHFNWILDSGPEWLTSYLDGIFAAMCKYHIDKPNDSSLSGLGFSSARGRTHDDDKLVSLTPGYMQNRL